MPIEIDRLDDQPPEVLSLEEGSQPQRILHFLMENDDQAFRLTEIAEATGIERTSVSAALTRLRDRDLVRHRGRYWAIGEDHRLGSYAAQLHGNSSAAQDDYYGEGE